MIFKNIVEATELDRFYNLLRYRSYIEYVYIHIIFFRYLTNLFMSTFILMVTFVSTYNHFDSASYDRISIYVSTSGVQNL